MLHFGIICLNYFGIICCIFSMLSTPMCIGLSLTASTPRCAVGQSLYERVSTNKMTSIGWRTNNSCSNDRVEWSRYKKALPPVLKPGGFPLRLLEWSASSAKQRAQKQQLEHLDLVVLRCISVWQVSFVCTAWLCSNWVAQSTCLLKLSNPCCFIATRHLGVPLCS